MRAYRYHVYNISFLQVSASHTVADVKQILWMQTSMSIDEQNLVYKGKTLAGIKLKVKSDHDFL